ncbi:MAG: amidase [Verrucomicrobiales bacterium]|jgi:amidase
MSCRKVAAQLSSFFSSSDLLLTPTLTHPSRPIGYHDPTEENWFTYLGRMLDDIAFTPLFNASGGPAVSMPLGTDSTGLPVGVQLGAKVGAEELLLSVSRQVERASPWHDRV